MQEPERCADLRKELSAERRAKTELGRGLAELRSKERAWRKERQVSLTIACHALPRWLWEDASHSGGAVRRCVIARPGYATR